MIFRDEAADRKAHSKADRLGRIETPQRLLQALGIESVPGVALRFLQGLCPDNQFLWPTFDRGYEVVDGPLQVLRPHAADPATLGAREAVLGPGPIFGEGLAGEDL